MPDETEAGLFFLRAPADNDDDAVISRETLAGRLFLSAPGDIDEDAAAAAISHEALPGRLFLSAPVEDDGAISDENRACALETGVLCWSEADHDLTLLFLFAPLSAFELSTARSGVGSVRLLLRGVLRGNWDVVALPGNAANEAAAGSALEPA